MSRSCERRPFKSLGFSQRRNIRCVCASLVCLHLHVLLCYHNGIGLEKISKSFNLCERLTPDKVYICKSQAMCYVQTTHVMLRMYRSHMSFYVCTDHTCHAMYRSHLSCYVCTDHTCHAMYRSHMSWYLQTTHVVLHM